MHTLYCTPLGETMRDEFVAELAGAVEQGRGHEHAFLLPSAHLLGAVRRELRVRGPVSYEQPGLLAFDDLVGEIAALAGYPHRLMDRMTQEIVVADILDSLNKRQALPYFSAISTFPGYISTVTSLLAEIKRTAAPPEEFPVGASGSQAKDAEVHAIYAAYQGVLATRKLADLEEMYFLAIQALAEGVTLPYRKVFISEFYILTPLQLALVKELKRVAAVDIGIVYEPNRPEVFAAVEQTYTDLVGMGFAPVHVAARRRTAVEHAHIRRNLFAAKPATIDAAPGLAVVSSPTRTKEMAVTAARIKKLLLSGDCRPAEIAVVVRDTSAWADFQDICGDFGLPVSLAREERLVDQPPARLLVNALTAKTDGGARATVLNLIKSPLVADALGIDADAVEQAALSKVIRSWRDWFGVFKGENSPENLNESRKSFDTLGRLVTSLPRQGTCAAFAAALKTVLDTLRIPTTLGEAYKTGRLPLPVLQAGLLAWQKCGETLDAVTEGFAFAGQADKLLPAAEFLRFFRQALAGQSIRLEGHNDQAVQVVSPAGVRGVTFRAVFILGLTDGEFPLRERENWLYDDRERAEMAALGLTLTTASFRRAEEDFYFAIAVALAGETLTLSGREDAETLLSPYVAEVVRLFAPATVIAEKYSAVEFFPAAYDGVFSARELAGKALLDTGDYAGPEACAAAAYVLATLTDDDFVRRVAVEKDRGRGCDPYGGFVGNDGGGHGPSVFSITALEEYAQCPFRYFATRSLKLREWEEKEEEAGYDVIGNIYHEVLAAFLRAHRGETLDAAKSEDYREELAVALDDVCRRLAEGDKSFNTKAWDYRRRRLEATLRRWLDFEIAEQNGDGLAFTPAFLEWGFGLPLAEGMDAASVSEPLEIVVGDRQLRIVGKIDRIDAAGDKLAVTDYKRKSTPRFRDLAAGTDLQAALYIMAAERFLCPAGGEVAGGGYYSVENARKEGGMWRAELAGDIGHRAAKDAGNLAAADWDALQAELRRLAGEYCAGIRRGEFPVRPALDCPPYCVARSMCRYRPEDGRPAGGETNG
ncbi:PD-(D/E)XK nuclease family protein [Anaeroselena agilis]|uniref:PD-(D/E)XK nuclease family protein n=1 Tax=Anaeroselena agilis TaxID=3063788 RepID=A0ABU3NUN3_9FIRM|nr:PD-(D/E)XK nuclease family protein [Selenomonadales bacterium 4137-cl]